VRYLKEFNENKDVFHEYKLEWYENSIPQEIFDTRLSRLLRFVRVEGIRSYTIIGITRNGDTKLVLKTEK
jgi:hypothetical protein